MNQLIPRSAQADMATAHSALLLARTTDNPVEVRDELKRAWNHIVSALHAVEEQFVTDEDTQQLVLPGTESE